MDIVDPDIGPCPMFVLAEHYGAFEGPWHAHRRAQLIYAADGLLTIRTARGMWVVPPRRAVWITPHEPHQGHAPRGFLLKTLFLEPGLVCIPSTCGVVSVDRLLDALLTEAASFGPDYPSTGPEQRLMDVVLDRLHHLKPEAAFLPAARDARLNTLTRMLEQDPADARPLDALAAQAGMTARTAARLFIKDTGMTFAQWRQQLRLLKALQALGMGTSVTSAAMDVGYGDVSAFIAVFKNAFGMTPARYFKRVDGS